MLSVFERLCTGYFERAVSARVIVDATTRVSCAGDLASALQDETSRTLAGAQALLFPDGYGVASGDEEHARPTLRTRLATRWTRAAVAAVLLPLFLLLLLYGVYHYVVGQSVDTRLAQIHL